MSRGPLRRRLSGTPWISLGVSMSVVESAGSSVGVGLVHSRERVEEGKCQVTGLGPPQPHFQKTQKIKNCSSVPFWLVGGVETTAGGGEGMEEIVSTLFKGA